MFPQRTYVFARRLIVALLLCFSLVAGFGDAYAADNVIYVDDDSSILGDGSSWAKAYVRLQDALAAATPVSRFGWQRASTFPINPF